MTFILLFAFYTLFSISSGDNDRQPTGNDHLLPEYSHGVDMRIPPVFRPGSGAMVTLVTADPLSSLTKYHSTTFKPYETILTLKTLKYFTLFGAAITAVLILLQMMPGYRGGNHAGGNNRDYQYRVPPSWSPETESHYPFRAYMTDVSLWMVLTDLQPHQQCAAIVARLGGAARDMARMLTPQEIMHGG